MKRTLCHEIHEFLAEANAKRWNTKEATWDLTCDSAAEILNRFRDNCPMAKCASDEEIKRALMTCGYRVLAHGNRYKVGS